MGTLSDSDYKLWIEGEDDVVLADDIVFEEDKIGPLEEELRKLKKLLKKKLAEIKRLSDRNEKLTELIRKGTK